MPETPLTRKQIRNARGWMTLVLIGLMLFLIGVYPNLIGMDRSPVIGFPPPRTVHPNQIPAKSDG